jgi:hypothetical protein
MIAVSSSGKNFSALASYLTTGRTGEERGRIAWSASRNLPTDDPELAATFMRATAARSDRVEKPVYHIALSFDPGDLVDRAAMERLASRVLDRLGLAEHQAVVVAHQDRDHPHVHIFVNRVHPETGKAWERWKDQPVIQQVLREEEAALGLRRVAPSLAMERDGAVDAPGLFTDGPREVTANRPVALQRSREEPRSRVEQVKRDLEQYERVSELSREHYAAKLELEAARSRTSRVDGAFERAKKEDEAFTRTLGSVFTNPEEAKRGFLRRAHEEGLDAAMHSLQEHPEHFGTLRTEERRRALGLVRSEDDHKARSAAPEAARRGAAAVEAETAAWVAVLDARARRLEDTFERKLRTVYEGPAAARAQFESVARRSGAENAMETMKTKPAEFGRIRASIAVDDASLSAAARRAAEAGREAVEAREQARAANAERVPARIDVAHLNSERQATREHLERAIERERGVREELKRRPRESELRQRIVRTIDTLLPHEARRLKMAVTAPHLTLAASVKSAAREVLLGPDNERQR